MSFDLICSNCGATSGPSVGVCPYCKSVLSGPSGSKNPTLQELQKKYAEGSLENALSLAHEIETQKPELRKDPEFALLYVQILLEAEAPASKMKSLLTETLLAVENPTLNDYLDIVQAKGMLSHDPNDAGEVLLKAVIRRSPTNPHANFILGSHLFWVENNKARSLKYLEDSVKNRPNFLRANACLAALYQALGNAPLAERYFKKCEKLESSAEMKKYFSSLAQAAVSR